MADHHATAEWEQVLEGVLTFLRTQASQELSISAVIRIERNAWRRSQQVLAALGVDGELPLATDELLAGAVSPTSRQDVTEQVLGAAEPLAAENAAQPTFNPEADLQMDEVDDGPEGVDDAANREVSEELAFGESLDTAEIDMDDEEDEDMATAAPHTPTPILTERREEALPGDDVQTFEQELDLDSLDAEALEPEPEIEAEIEAELELEELEAFEEGEPEGEGPLLPDFDFDDESEQDETVVFAMGAGQTGEEIARLIDDQTDTANALPAASADGDDGFDLMPDLADDLELEELDLDEAEEQTVLDPDLEIELDEPVHTPEPAPLPIDTRAAPSARVAAGLYANPNVPTVREGRAPPPRAAAIAINAKAGTGKVIGFEAEEEPLEIGSAEDYGEEEEYVPPSRGGGFSLDIQEYEEDDEYEDDDEDEPEPPAPAPPPPPVFQGPDQSQIDAVLQRAHQAAANGDMQAGVDLFSDVLDADPDSVEAYVGRGRLYLDLGDYSRSMSDFITAEDLEPQNPEPQVAIGDLYFARKDYRKAIDYFNEALGMDPNHAMAHCRRGISHYYRKNYSEALADLKTAETLNRDIPNIGTYISMARKKAKK